MDDQWSAGADDGPGRGGGFGDDGAFDVGRMLGWALATLQEQPLLVLLGGFNLVLVSALPGLLSTPLNTALQVSTDLGELDEVTSQAVQIGVSVSTSAVFMPIQMLVSAGVIAAIGHYVRTGEVGLSTLYTSVGGALRALLYGLLSGIISFFVTLLFLSPGIAMLVAAVQLGDDMLLPLLAIGMLLIFVGLIAFIPVGLGLALGVLPAVLDEAGPTEALALSWEAARGNRVNLFVFYLVTNILVVFGMCCCYLPAIPVLGAQWAGLTAAWLKYSRPTETTASWAFFQRNS